MRPAALLLMLPLLAHAELPDLGEPEPERVSLLPAFGIAIAAALADQSIKANATNPYPAAHYEHIAGGALLAGAVTHYYGPRMGWTVGLSYAVLSEAYGRTKGKTFRYDDVLTRSIGTGMGVWLSLQF